MIEKDVAAFWKMYLETECLIFVGDQVFPDRACIQLGLLIPKVKHQEFWKGYLQALKAVGIEVLGISKERFENLTFDFKLRVARRLRQKYPYAETGFVYGLVFYTVEEIDALESVRNLY